MKKLEKIIFIGSTFGLVIKTLQIPGGALVTFVSIATLAIFYYIFTFFLVNDKTWKDIFVWDTYKSSGVFNIILSLVCGFGLSIAIISFLFQLMKWEDALAMSIAGLFSVGFSSIIVVATFSFEKTEWKKQLIYRLFFYGLLNLIMFLLVPCNL